MDWLMRAIDLFNDHPDVVAVICVFLLIGGGLVSWHRAGAGRNG